MGERRDEAEPAAGLRDPAVARRPARAVVDLFESPALGQLGPHHGERQILVEPGFLADLAHGHDLDEGQVEALVAAPADQAVELVVVDALEGDSVDLDRQPRPLGRFQALHDPVQLAPAGDRGELVRIERVERDVDPPHPQVGQLPGVAGQLAAVGGQGQLVERPALEVAREVADQAHDVAPDQGLAAGQAQLAHALAHEGAAQAVQLLEAQDLGLGQEGHVFRHAVDTAEVAAVSDRNPEIGDRPAEGIDHRTHAAPPNLAVPATWSPLPNRSSA